MRMVAVGTEAVGVFAFGQRATGVVAVGQLSLGVISVGQLSRGVISIGQLSCGVFSFGQMSLGALWSGGMLAVAPTTGVALVPIGILGRWVPWRRGSATRRLVLDRPIRWLFALACLAAVTALSLLPLSRAFTQDDGVLREPPPVLR